MEIVPLLPSLYENATLNRMVREAKRLRHATPGDQLTQPYLAKVIRLLETELSKRGS